MKKKLVIAGLLGGGLYVGYRLFVAEAAAAAIDPAGNPPGTVYDDEGRGLHVPPPADVPEGLFTPGVGEGVGVFWQWPLEMQQDSYTVPTGQGGPGRGPGDQVKVIPQGGSEPFFEFGKPDRRQNAADAAAVDGEDANESGLRRGL